VGALAPRLASMVAEPRYGAGAPGHDPEDEALAPLGDLAAPNLRIATAVAGAIAGVLLANQYTNWKIATVLLVLAGVLLVACLVDLRYLRLPNLLTYGGAAGVLVGAAVVTLDLGETLEGRSVRGQWLTGAVVGAVFYAGFLLLVATLFQAVRGKAGMGLGDVKLALSLGLTLGWIGWVPEASLIGTFRYVVYAALAGNVLGAIGGLALTRLRPGRSFPFGPFLALGWLIVLALQP
jgi:leader peptidase (prepilin peptidase)/N-methyltransferase